MFFVIFSLTCIDKVLVGQSWMIHIVNGSRKESSKDLQRCEHALKEKQQVNIDHVEDNEQTG